MDGKTHTVINHSPFLIEYRREEAERKSRAAFREQIINGARDESLPTKKFNGKSFEFSYFAYFKKDAKKWALKLTTNGYATKISKGKEDKEHKYRAGKPYFIVWKL